MLHGPDSYLPENLCRNDDHAHPPIHPTKAAPPGGFESREMDRLYEYIARRFLACCSIDAIGAETVFVARVGAEYFNAKGMIVQRKGFYEVFIYERWVDKELPQVAVRDLVPIESLELREAKTEPPPLLSESDLIALMDRSVASFVETPHRPFHVEKAPFSARKDTHRIGPPGKLFCTAQARNRYRCDDSAAH